MSARLLVGARPRRALAGRRAAPRQGPARRADHRRGDAARAAVRRADRRPHLGDARARRHLRRRRPHPGPGRPGRARSGPASTSAARSTTRDKPCCTSRSTCPPPGRDGIGPAQLDELEALVRAAGGRTLGLFSSMRAARDGRRGDARAAGRRRCCCRATTRRRRWCGTFARDATTCLFGTLSLWQGVDVPGPGLPAGRHRPGAVPAPGRPAGVGPLAGGGRQRWQRLHDGRGDPCRAPAGAGLRPADPVVGRPGRGGGARLPALDRAVRRLPAGVAAAVLADDRPGRSCWPRWAGWTKPPVARSGRWPSPGSRAAGAAGASPVAPAAAAAPR